jgi:ABC-type branched-subunit amino acid transport system ATPase component
VLRDGRLVAAGDAETLHQDGTLHQAYLGTSGT